MVRNWSAALALTGPGVLVGASCGSSGSGVCCSGGVCHCLAVQVSRLLRWGHCRRVLVLPLCAIGSGPSDLCARVECFIICARRLLRQRFGIAMLHRHTPLLEAATVVECGQARLRTPVATVCGGPLRVAAAVLRRFVFACPAAWGIITWQAASKSSSRSPLSRFPHLQLHLTGVCDTGSIVLAHQYASA